MPYYSELGIYTSPSSTYSSVASVYIPGPYSNHSSIIASNFSRPPPILKARNIRSYKPHLATITENQSHLRRVSSPKILHIPRTRPVKINTADIDVSLNKYRKYDRIVKDNEDKKSPSPSENSKEVVNEVKNATPSKIRRNRRTVRLQTIHADLLPQMIKGSWRDNFDPHELNTEEEIKRPRKTPGALLMEKFLIKDNNDQQESQPKPNQQVENIRKSPSFHDICTAITVDQTEELNPGQPLEIQRRQSRQFATEDFIRQLSKTGSEMSLNLNENEDILESLKREISRSSSLVSLHAEQQENLSRSPSEMSIDDKEVIANVKKKKKVTRKKSDDNFDENSKSMIHRQNVKKYKRTSSNSSEIDEETEKAYQEAIRDTSQVEIEKVKIKQKPIITATVNIEENKPLLKAVIDEVEITESPKPKNSNRFKFNVIVEEVEEPQTKKMNIILENKNKKQNGIAHTPKPKDIIVNNILKTNRKGHLGHVLENIEEVKKKNSFSDKNKLDFLEKSSHTKNDSEFVQEKNIFQLSSPFQNKNSEARQLSSSTPKSEKQMVGETKASSPTVKKNLVLSQKESKEQIEEKGILSPTIKKSFVLPQGENKEQIEERNTPSPTIKKTFVLLQKGKEAVPAINQGILSKSSSVESQKSDSKEEENISSPTIKSNFVLPPKENKEQMEEKDLQSPKIRKSFVLPQNENKEQMEERNTPSPTIKKNFVLPQKGKETVPAINKGILSKSSSVDSQKGESRDEENISSPTIKTNFVLPSKENKEQVEDKGLQSPKIRKSFVLPQSEVKDQTEERNTPSPTVKRNFVLPQKGKDVVPAINKGILSKSSSVESQKSESRDTPSPTLKSELGEKKEEEATTPIKMDNFVLLNNKGISSPTNENIIVPTGHEKSEETLSTVKKDSVPLFTSQEKSIVSHILPKNEMSQTDILKKETDKGATSPIRNKKDDNKDGENNANLLVNKETENKLLKCKTESKKLTFNKNENITNVETQQNLQKIQSDRNVFKPGILKNKSQDHVPKTTKKASVKIEEVNFWDQIEPRETVYMEKRKTVRPAHSERENKQEITVQESAEEKQKENQMDKSEEQNEKEATVKAEEQKRMLSKRSLINKANIDDPDLHVFVVPEQPEEEKKEEQEEKKDVFVPLQSNRLSQFMNPFKKPEQFDVCPIEIFARPKTIRKRHYPKRFFPQVPQSSSESEESSSEESSSEEDDNDEEEEDDVVGSKVGASTSSNDSGFDSGKKKGSSETKDSPTSNPMQNPAFALDSAENLEEYSQSSTYASFQKSGRITPPATTIPRFKKYCVDDFNFLKVLGMGSFGKVLLAELKDTEYYYAIKCLKKDVVLEDDDVECTLIERKVLALGTKHPYLCHLLCTFQTESHLFFVMEYLNGGDLMFHIQQSGRFPEATARFYGAEIVSGLKFLHNKGIVYRDLKLDNILLDFEGHVRIADFGMCKLQIFLDRMADTFCGTPDYMAPEIIKGQHYNQCVDWWSFGVLLYEMLIGQSPFSGCDEDELFWSICNEKPIIPRFLSNEASSVLILFLEKDASKRLGNRFCPNGDIQDQPFFRPIDWNKVESRQLEPPFKPNLQHPLDTQYFDKNFTKEKAKLTPIDPNILQSMDQTQFQGFSYTNPNATDK